MSKIMLYIIGILIIALRIAYEVYQYRKRQRQTTGNVIPASIPPPQPPLVISRELIDSTEDDSLSLAVWDGLFSHVTTMVNGDYSKEYQIVEGLSKGVQIMYATYQLEGEVCNGGFSQFFFNSSNQFADMALEAYRLLGAEKHEALLKRAIDIAIPEIPQLAKHRKAFDKTHDVKEYVEYRDLSDLNDLDDIFYELGRTEDIDLLRAMYIRKHVDEFVLA